MQRLILIFFTTVAVAVLGVALANDGDTNVEGRVWQDHAPPYTFLFGNHIDTHQETRLKKNGDLQGFFYIYWTGEFTNDGDPIAHHCTKPEHYTQGCFAGWSIRAKPCIKEVKVNEEYGCEAMFLYHFHDHPVWLIGPRVVDGGLRGTRSMVPQPGSYTHFHWLTEGSSHMDDWLPSSIADVEALFGVDIAVPEECNVAMASALTAGVVCPGYYLEIKAKESFVFRHGGELIPVEQGIDNRTHLNIVTSYRSLPHDVLPGEYVETGDGGGGH
jgi:hypothetical protein